MDRAIAKFATTDGGEMNEREGKLIDVKKWLRGARDPGLYKPSMPHLPYFAHSGTREKARLEYLAALQEWEALWNKEQENRLKELNAIQSLHTVREWQELMYDLTKPVRQILMEQEDRRRAIKQKSEEDAKIFSVISNIVGRYPWPTAIPQKSKSGKDKLRQRKIKYGHNIAIVGRIHENDKEDTSTVECPICGKVFMSLDQDGCCTQDFGRCEDVIGEGDDDDLHFNKDFNLLSGILSLFCVYSNDDCIYNYINPLAEVHLDEGDDWLLFFEALGISVTTNTWDGGGPCHSGCYSILTVRRDSQEFLLSKLVVILNRLKALEEHDKNEGSRERP